MLVGVPLGAVLSTSSSVSDVSCLVFHVGHEDLAGVLAAGGVQRGLAEAVQAAQGVAGNDDRGRSGLVERADRLEVLLLLVEVPLGAAMPHLLLGLQRLLPCPPRGP